MAENLPRREGTRDTASGTPHIAVCIATYRRPQGLARLLRSLDRLEFCQMTPRVTLVIADNAPDAPAAEALGDPEALTQWETIYVMAPVRGIASARNRALDMVPRDADLIAFVDDDETVAPGWLEALAVTMRDTDAAAVQGTVEPEFQQDPPGWMQALRIFHLGPFQQNARLCFAATNNSMIDARLIRDNGLRFDVRFNDTGGEDEEFFNRVRALGGEIRAASSAVVRDSVPAGRMTLRWVLRRAHRKGNTLGRIALIRRKGRVMRCIKGVGAIGVGLFTLSTAGLVSQTRRIGALMEMARGAGMLTAFARMEFAEYGERALRLDRSRES